MGCLVGGGVPVLYTGRTVPKGESTGRPARSPATLWSTAPMKNTVY